MALGGMTNSNVSAADDPVILKLHNVHKNKLVIKSLDDSSDKIKRLFEEGTQQVECSRKIT